MEDQAAGLWQKATQAMPAICRTFELRSALGLHARPAALIAKAAAGFAADITVALDTRRANAKSILALLTLGAAPGAELRVTVEGSDAPEAIRAMERLLATDLDARW